ncbi:DUF6000 family protein [Streptomyces sp. NPDC013181]|uniref:DUF6000 family protein n=1 Tax=Streptomyces sp. NPDC013181 TaxID=3364864 RepID=UPI0036BC6393
MRRAGRKRPGSVPGRRGRIAVVVRRPHDDAELSALVRRHVTPERRYLKLGGGLLSMRDPDRERFVRDLREDAGRITADEITKLLEGGWRERRTAAWVGRARRRGSASGRGASPGRFGADPCQYPESWLLFWS